LPPCFPPSAPAYSPAPWPFLRTFVLPPSRWLFSHSSSFFRPSRNPVFLIYEQFTLLLFAFFPAPPVCGSLPCQFCKPCQILPLLAVGKTPTVLPNSFVPSPILDLLLFAPLLVTPARCSCTQNFPIFRIGMGWGPLRSGLFTPTFFFTVTCSFLQGFARRF